MHSLFALFTGVVWFERAGDFAGALAKFSSASLLDAGDFTLHELKAQVLLQMAKPFEAINVCLCCVVRREDLRLGKGVVDAIVLCATFRRLPNAWSCSRAGRKGG